MRPRSRTSPDRALRSSPPSTTKWCHHYEHSPANHSRRIGERVRTVGELFAGDAPRLKSRPDETFETGTWLTTRVDPLQPDHRADQPLLGPCPAHRPAGACERSSYSVSADNLADAARPLALGSKALSRSPCRGAEQAVPRPAGPESSASYPALLAERRPATAARSSDADPLPSASSTAVPPPAFARMKLVAACVAQRVAIATTSA